MKGCQHHCNWKRKVGITAKGNPEKNFYELKKQQTNNKFGNIQFDDFLLSFFFLFLLFIAEYCYTTKVHES